MQCQKGNGFARKRCERSIRLVRPPTGLVPFRILTIRVVKSVGSLGSNIEARHWYWNSKFVKIFSRVLRIFIYLIPPPRPALTEDTEAWAALAAAADESTSLSSSIRSLSILMSAQSRHLSPEQSPKVDRFVSKNHRDIGEPTRFFLVKTTRLKFHFIVASGRSSIQKNEARVRISRLWRSLLFVVLTWVDFFLSIFFSWWL